MEVISLSIFRSKFIYKCNKVQRLDSYQNICMDCIEVKIKLLTVCSRAGNSFKATQTGLTNMKGNVKIQTGANRYTPEADIFLPECF